MVAPVVSVLIQARLKQLRHHNVFDWACEFSQQALLSLMLLSLAVSMKQTQTLNHLFVLLELYCAHANDNEIDSGIDCLPYKIQADFGRLICTV
jgi:hypothetical protein